MDRPLFDGNLLTFGNLSDQKSKVHAKNGADIIHDWELAYQGATSEDVREHLSKGTFGLLLITGYFIKAAANDLMNTINGFDLPPGRMNIPR